MSILLGPLEARPGICAATGCDELLGARIVLCPRHWDMCPDAVQERVVVMWNRAQRAAFAEARDAMIAAVNAEIARTQEGATA